MTSQRLNTKLALNTEILSQGVESLRRPDAKAQTKRIANTSTTEWNIGTGASGGGTFQEHWPSHLPRPPSQKKLTVEAEDPKMANVPRMVVFNANTEEGSSLVRVLSEKGLRVTAVVRVTSNRNTKKLLKLKHVTIKVADLNNFEAVQAAAKGCQQAFLVTKFWERFENPIEEAMAGVVVEACQSVKVAGIVLAAFEDTHELRLRGRKSQIVPTPDGRIFPNFDGMAAIDAKAKNAGIKVTHMFTSYLDEKGSKKSLVLIRGENGKIISQPHIENLKA